ncbi:MAG: DUF1707 SHOCT-like domain-containing protein [Solirubrobacteraceae bacterium]
MASRSAIRASDDDRESVAEHLRRAAGEGRLKTEELEHRLGTALSALTYGELDRLTADLPRRIEGRPHPRGRELRFARRLALLLAIPVALVVAAAVALAIAGALAMWWVWIVLAWVWIGRSRRRRFDFRYARGRWHRGPWDAGRSAMRRSIDFWA